MARKVLDDNGVLYFWSKIKAFFVAKEDGKGLSTNDYTTAEKNKLAGITSGANKYTHPTYTAHTSGLYKIANDATGHVSGATAVTKADITALGIPAQDTTYTAASQTKMGLLTAAGKIKLDGIADGAEVNQNAFSTVRVGQTGEFSFSASTKTDTITLSTGGGVTLTLDADRKTVTFSCHTHANADTLDKITADVYAEIMGAKNKAHTHTNADVLNATTASFTTALLTKLNGIATGANKTTVDSALSSTSTNPVQNKVVNTALSGKISTSARGAKNGVASLDANGLIPSSQLPSFVDDVIEGYYSDGKFYKEETHKTEITGATGKIYVDLSTNLSYRYGGSAYVQITSSDMVAITNAEIDTICV
nr:MAG TPA: Peptidase [Caudoviricetes sp.]